MFQIPGRLVFRTVVLLCALLAMNTLLLFAMYKAHLRTVVAPREGEVLGDLILFLRSDIERVPGAELQQWLDRFDSYKSISVTRLPGGTAPVDHPGLSAIMLAFEASLRQRAGDDIRLDLQKSGADSVVWIDFNAAGRRYRLAFPGNGVAAPRVWPLFWIIISSGLIVSLVVVFVVTQINRPLKRSATALAESADQLSEITMPPSAPEEFRAFAERFNYLAQRLRMQEHERTLLMAGVSHDLRAPLTRIRVNAEMIDDKNPGMVGSILRDSDSMSHIINQFLDHQRGVNPRLVGRIDICPLVESLVKRFCGAGHDVRLTGITTANVVADPTALERILGNLIDNAVTYGEEPVEVQIAVEDQTVLIEVRDHGPGIAEAEIARLCRPFERLDPARGNLGHCGLGLAIVDRLVKQLNGAVTFRNHLEGGLRAVVKLPAAGPLVVDG
jgi:two-component system osmolarity sensor histidine kinase EnvZ